MGVVKLFAMHPLLPHLVLQSERSGLTNLLRPRVQW